MRKKFLSLLLALSIIISACGIISLTNVFAETAPFTFEVKSVDGSDVILDGTNNYSAQLKFVISPKGGTFSEDITLEKIVNTSNSKEVILGSAEDERKKDSRVRCGDRRLRVGLGNSVGLENKRTRNLPWTYVGIYIFALWNIYLVLYEREQGSACIYRS
jgi:hypothetical protein